MKVKKQLQFKANKMKPKFHHLRHPFMIPVFTFFVFFFLGIALFINQSGQTVGASDSRIVELTINGNVKVIPTSAPTVGDLFKSLNITVSNGDVVEPSITTPILENNFQINIYRVHPVTVIENGQKTVIATAENDPKVIAKEAGYTIYPQDYVTAANNADNLGNGVLGQQVNIDPSIPVNLDLYGTQVTERTHAKTVAELLANDKIKTNSGTNVLPSLDTPITPNLPVLVVPVGQHLVSTQKDIPFDTQNVNDPTIPFGTTAVAQQGVDGLELEVQDLDAKTGVPVGAPLQQVVITAPLSEIVKHGTGIVAVEGGNNISWLKSSNINVSDYSYVDYIMTRESHWNPADVNGRGCIGLGQFCNQSNLTIPCPDWQIDASCQLNVFNSYAVSKYGTWANAVAFWQSHGWW